MKLRLVGITGLEKTEVTQVHIGVKRPRMVWSHSMTKSMVLFSFEKSLFKRAKVESFLKVQRDQLGVGSIGMIIWIFPKRLQSQEQVMAVYSKLNHISV